MKARSKVRSVAHRRGLMYGDRSTATMQVLANGHAHGLATVIEIREDVLVLEVLMAGDAEVVVYHVPRGRIAEAAVNASFDLIIDGEGYRFTAHSVRDDDPEYDALLARYLD